MIPADLGKFGGGGKGVGVGGGVGLAVGVSVWLGAAVAVAEELPAMVVGWPQATTTTASNEAKAPRIS